MQQTGAVLDVGDCLSHEILAGLPGGMALIRITDRALRFKPARAFSYFWMAGNFVESPLLLNCVVWDALSSCGTHTFIRCHSLWTDQGMGA